MLRAIGGAIFAALALTACGGASATAPASRAVAQVYVLSGMSSFFVGAPTGYIATVEPSGCARLGTDGSFYQSFTIATAPWDGVEETGPEVAAKQTIRIAYTVDAAGTIYIPDWLNPQSSPVSIGSAAGGDLLVYEPITSNGITLSRTLDYAPEGPGATCP